MVAEVDLCAAHTIFASGHVIFTGGDIAAHATRPGDYRPAFLQSGGKNAAGGDYSSCGYISANHRHYGKTGEKQGKTPIVVRDKPGFTSIAS